MSAQLLFGWSWHDQNSDVGWMMPLREATRLPARITPREGLSLLWLGTSWCPDANSAQRAPLFKIESLRAGACRIDLYPAGLQWPLHANDARWPMSSIGREHQRSSKRVPSQ